MKKTVVLPSLMLLTVISLPLAGQEAAILEFIHKEGDVLHADSLVDESIYIDGFLSHQAEIDEFSVSRILEVDSRGTAELETVFRTVERVDGRPGYLEWVSSETVLLERNALGEMTVPLSAARPVLRNMPRFPEEEIGPGDSWSLPAEEVHVFRINGRLYGPYRGDVQVFYSYRDNIYREIGSGESSREDAKLARIDIRYDVYLPVREAGEPIRLITGRSRQTLLWDITRGRPAENIEDFEFMMVMADGRTQEFVGTGDTRYRYTEELDRREAATAFARELDGLPGITVEPVDNGVLLSLLENDAVLFDPESARISEDQKHKLNELARSLAAYSDRDILISGHTAHYGTAAGRQRLSRNRAAAVADILFPDGRPGPGRLFLRGAGSTEPRGSDDLDRRVEILILD